MTFCSPALVLTHIKETHFCRLFFIKFSSLVENKTKIRICCFIWPYSTSSSTHHCEYNYNSWDKNFSFYSTFLKVFAVNQFLLLEWKWVRKQKQKYIFPIINQFSIKITFYVFLPAFFLHYAFFLLQLFWFVFYFSLGFKKETGCLSYSCC